MQAPTDNAAFCTLDHNGQLPLSLRLEAGVLHGAVDLRGLGEPDVLGGPSGHLQQGLTLLLDEREITPPFSYEAAQLLFEAPHGDAVALALRIYGEPILHFTRMGDRFVMSHARAYERLTVTELRMLATSEIKPAHVPASRTLYTGFDAGLHAPITELHTHSSGQIGADALIDMAMAHGLDYPTELLDRLGIELTTDERAAIKPRGGLGFRFSPLESEGLACEIENAPCDVVPLSTLTIEHRALLARQMCVPQDVAICFSDFDREFYRFVNPLVKNAVLTRDLILHIARDYQKHGVRYSELSTASMLNLDEKGEAGWFREMIAAVKQAEEETGVQLRFLVGVPRTYGPAKVMAEIAKIKFAVRHPLIAGIDLLGYESNKTSDFAAALAHIADWARAYHGSELTPARGWDFKRDLTIRIHAGETGKHSGNVAEATRIAERFGIRVRISHALNEDVDEALDATIERLSSFTPPLLSMEFCPDSNIGYNNIQHLRDIPFKRWLACCASWFLGSDGAGAIQTTPEQLALSALAAGVTLQQLVGMRKQELAFIADQQQRFDAKSRAYANYYADDSIFLKEMALHIRAIQSMTDPKTLDPIRPSLPDEFAGKTPILVAGASSESLADVDAGTQQIIREAMQLLVDALDPSHVYFVVGRTKHEGVTAMLDDALMAHNARQPTNKYEVLALTTEDTTDLAHAISWVVPQKGTREKVPDNLISFMRHSPIKGLCIFIGGKNFTADMILKCRRSKLAYLLMENASGASQQFAEKTVPEKCFTDAASLLKRIAENLPGALR